MKRVFIANRGEIAVRIVRACRSLGLECVVGCSNVDRDGLAARLADQAVTIGPGPARDSYLRADLVVQAALGTGCDAIHPGYGFLAESVALSSLAQEHGLAFVGPPVEVMALTGDKLRAREAAREAGLPVLPGREVASVAEAARVAAEIGFPVLLKAAGGGGGRGIKLVREPGELDGVFALARAEAGAAFGDERVYVERFIAAARHIEVQIAGDVEEVVDLGERDCSVQRRYQKIIEEAPARLSGGAREAIRAAAVSLGRELGYRNLGTVEFVVDAATEEFYFLEVNCRIQVEHPVTEIVVGRDLVALQLTLAGAGGGRLGFGQDDVHIDGHAIECRLCAEDPVHEYRPSPGRLSMFFVPEAEGLRVDTHCFAGAEIPPFYDSLMAKLIGFGEDRASAVAVLLDALEDVDVDGVETNRALLIGVLGHPEFLAGPVATDWLGRVVA